MKRLLVLVALLLSLFDVGRAQVLTTAGNDFWLAFVPNHRQGDLTLIVSSDQATTGTAVSADSSWSQTFTVLPGVVTNVTVPSFLELDTVQRTVRNKGIHVTTDANVSLYLSNYLQASYDNTNVLPTNTLRNHYLLQTVDSNEWDNEFCVVATDDSTLVNINMSVYDKDSVMVPGVTYSVQLNRGQAYLVRSHGDLSGTLVWTDSCKRIAVFTGNMCAYVPAICGACDHLVEQSIPTEYWGRRFGITTSELRTSDMLKITALHDSTEVRFDTNQFVLNARESRMFNIIRPLNEAGLYLEGSKPLSVFLYLKGSFCAGTLGDPSCTVIHPIEQQISYINFATFNTDRISSHHVNIVTRSVYASNLYIDEYNISPTNFRPLLGNTDYVYARITVAGGSHLIQSLQGGFVAHVYGLGERESYSYAVGATLDPINPYSFLNGRLFTMFSNTNNTFCLQDVFEFSAEVLDEPNTTIVWDFGDGDTATGIAATHIYRQPGDYIVTVHYTHYSDCYEPTHHVHTLPIHVIDQALSITDTVVCGTVCQWNGHRYYDVGQYSVKFQTGDICDSVARLNINAFYIPPSPMVSFEYDCDDNMCHLYCSGDKGYIRWYSLPHNPELNGHEGDTHLVVTPNIAREYHLYGADIDDTLCASDTSFIIPQIDVFQALISAKPSVVDLDNTSISLADVSHQAVSRVWYADDNEIGSSQKVVYDYPVYHDSVVITLASVSSYDCHDTTQMVLRLLSNDIYVPNIITPSQQENSYFQVYGSSLIDGEIWIFDRRGVQVWYSNDIHARWDATYDGSPLPQGTYVYTLRYSQIPDTDVWLHKMGTVTVIR